ncbi:MULTISPECIES: hypothetical protein [Streptomyces]|uniref:hypothetical protein n=1 Tax=Streptomyces TaxID=1883 RepID=UPI00177D7C85|nr:MULTISPECIES: hypothetical protein [Streptomyces]MDX3089377.1 hypothetical protein [Streptomyces sp. ME12-02E]MDX3332843.1 hypothetical protein [Streptomyces sp. ME02-6978a]GHE76171.1 hypothetical protein GCM10018782_57280 [Streptomyces griseoaurantiacus]
MFQTLARGCAAGAAGTTALNAVTYADMALRGRPTSSVPEDVVDRITADTGHPVPGTGDLRENRLTGLGALSGIAVGVGAGAAVALVHRAGVRVPLWLGGPVTGALAMAASDLPIARTGVSDPRTWSAKDWLSDIVPHVVYGLVTYGVVAAADHRD